MSLFANLEEQTSKPANQQTIIVDYIGANAGKPLHIGHICTPSIGQVVCNIYRHLGYRVIGDSHFGDWGGIFGKLITMNRIITAELNPTLFESKEQQENYKIIAKYLVEETRKMDIEKMDIEKLKKTMGYAQYLDSAWRAVEAKEKYDFVKMMFFSYQLITIYIEFSK
jgi:arginyl-tRNA synthetase